MVIVSYKRFTADENWAYLGELLPHVPTDDPAIIRPTWEKQIPIEKAKSAIKTCRAIMPEAKYNEWCNFQSNLEKNKGEFSLNKQPVYFILEIYETLYRTGKIGKNTPN